MKFQLASDIHLENFFGFGATSISYNHFEQKMLTILPPIKDTILLIAGDVTRVADNHHVYSLFLSYCSKNWYAAVIITGNHEYYTETTHATIEQINAFIKGKVASNVAFLNAEALTIPNTNIVIYGGTLWSHIPTYNGKLSLNIDFPIYTDSYGKFTSSIYNKYHEHSVLKLVDVIRQVREKNKMGENLKLVVLTHHTPTYEHIKLENRVPNERDPLYSTELSHLTQKKYVDTWICGHTHSNYDLYKNHKEKTRIISNCQPLMKSFVKDLVLEL